MHDAGTGFIRAGTLGELRNRHRTVLALKESAADGVRDQTVIGQKVRRALGRYFFEITQRKPVIVPVIMEV